MVQTKPRISLPVDLVLFASTLALVVIGLWMVFGSTFAKSLDASKYAFDAFYFVKRQAIGAIIGLGLLVGMMQVGYWNLRRFALPLLCVSLVLLVSVWLPGIGQEKSLGAFRSIHFGKLQFQPAELAKVALVLYLAALFSRPNCDLRSWSYGMGPALTSILLVLILIEREPDLGTAAVLFLAVMTQMYLAGARKRHLALIFAGIVVFGGVFIFAFGHRMDRLVAHINATEHAEGIGYQVLHARRAVGSGGWEGMGFGQGREKYYLTQGESDFIFAVLAEEMGLVRTLPVLALLLVVGWRGFRIALATKDRFGALLAAGIASVISWQALINIGVATCLLPATGVPLPFISFGSTSLIAMMMGVGILLNIARHPTPPVPAVEN